MPPEPMRPVNWGLLAASGIARRALAPAIVASKYASALAVASRDAAKAAAFAGSHGVARAYGSYEALLADPDIEVVYVSLPNSEHVTWVVRALQAGKHVLCEKPMHRDRGEVERACDAADQAGRLLMEAFMYRHHPDTQAMFGCVSSGEIGDVHQARSALSFTMPGMPGGNNIRTRPELHGGALMDVGCYAISVLRILAGEPEHVAGVSHRGATGVDLRFSAFMQCRNGATASFDCGLDLPSRSFVEVVGTKGTLRAEWPFFRPFFPHLDPPMIEVRIGLESRKLPLTDVNPYVAQVDNFSRAIRGLERPLLGRADALAQASVISALWRSADAQGEWVSTGL
jgi:D-xylose 1-dehydrogenase (NADP+, D-xylono-1,5-lactone-forming)